MEKALAQLSALSHPQRLAIFRLLSRRYPYAMPAGEIGAALDVRPSTLSAYLAALAGAGLIRQERRGTSLLYSVAIAEAAEMLRFLHHDCCRARAEISPQRRPGIQNVLFLCTDNAFLSQTAEAILRSLAGDRFEVFSAATGAPSGPEPLAMALLADRQHDTSCLWSKPVADLRGPDAPPMDFVITLSDAAANTDLGEWPEHPAQAHWPHPVSAQAEGIAVAYALLNRRLAAFCALDLDAPRAAVQSSLDMIARLGADQPAG